MATNPHAGPSSTRPTQPRAAAAAPPTPLPADSTTNLLLNPLNRLSAVAQQLFQSLAPPHTKPPPAPPAAALAEADAALAAALQLARAHQRRQRRIDALTREVLALEDAWRAVVVQLDGGRRALAAALAEGDARLEAVEQAKAGAIPHPELLAYAQSLSAFTSAPPNMPDLALPGQPPPPLFFPPFPNEEKMRRGHLNAEEPLGPLGETHSVGRPPSPSPEPQAYRPMEHRPPPQQMFDLDLDLNPDL